MNALSELFQLIVIQVESLRTLPKTIDSLLHIFQTLRCVRIDFFCNKTYQFLATDCVFFLCLIAKKFRKPVILGTKKGKVEKLVTYVLRVDT